MDKFKKQVRSSFRSEMTGAGYYAAIAAQYGPRHSELGEMLRKASDDEHMHGRLFRQFYNSAFNSSPGNEKFWIAAGRLAAFLKRPVSLEKKLKELAAIESRAVKTIEAVLSGEADSPFHKILRRILPDEKHHASIYDEFIKKQL